MLERKDRRRWLCAGGAHAVAAAAGWATAAYGQGAPALELGLLPNLSARVLMAQYRPVREGLQRRLQREVQLSTAPDWLSFHQRTLALTYDLVVTAANLARLAQVDAGWVPLVTYTPLMKGLLIAARLRPLSRLVELRGQRLALANPRSLLAQRGLHWLASQGLQPGADFHTVQVPQDDSVGALVRRGDCIAALLSDVELRAVPDDIRADLQVVQHFADAPGFVVAASPRLAPALQALLRQAWLELGSGSDDGRAFFALSGIGGIAEAGPVLMAALDPVLPETRRLFAPPP
jgi:phosphonate transport system substrate-binding protein